MIGGVAASLKGPRGSICRLPGWFLWPRRHRGAHDYECRLITAVTRPGATVRKHNLQCRAAAAAPHARCAAPVARNPSPCDCKTKKKL